MQLPRAEDFIISSGEVHTIKDFVEAVFSYLGLEWQKYVLVNSSLITKKQKVNLYGDNRKIHKTTGWSPSVNFKQLVKILVDEELKQIG